jgi:hypothetical protein
MDSRKISLSGLWLFGWLLVLTAASSAASGPLVVGRNSQVVVLEYEAWFGPKAVTFQNTAAMPLLQSASMRAVGGGYDSADPAVIKQHVAWMEYMGVDAALVDLTNNVSCIFNSAWFVKKYLRNCTPSFRAANQSIRDNTGNLYRAWDQIGTALKLIPLLGGIDQNVLIRDQDGKTAFEKEIEYFGLRMQQYPDRQVIYRGKPLLLVFLGAAQDPARADHPLWLQLREFLDGHPEIDRKFTVRMMAGYLDSQPSLWATQGTPAGPIELDPQYRFWSWVDRLNSSCAGSFCPYYPTYNLVDSRAENFTASIATAGQTGWGCPDSGAPPYCPDDSLRFGENGSYSTFESFMSEAQELKPIFLILHQFNEFTESDEGWDANTDDDIEPASSWRFGALETVRREIRAYRQPTPGSVQ